MSRSGSAVMMMHANMMMHVRDFGVRENPAGEG